MKTLRDGLVVCLVAAAAASAQHNKSGLAGVVRDSTGLPIPQAGVFLADGKAAAVSDDSGRFDVRGLPGGPNEVTITKIGFSPVSFTATLPNDSVVVVAIMLHRVQVLDAVSVSAAATRERLARTGFYERQRAGFGQYLTPEHDSPNSIGAVEVYDLASTVPMEYQRADGCATVLLWTKLKVSR